MRTFIEIKSVSGLTKRQAAEQLSEKLYALLRPNSERNPKDITNKLFGVVPHPVNEDDYVVATDSDLIFAKNSKANSRELDDLLEELSETEKTELRTFIENANTIPVSGIISRLASQIVAYDLWGDFPNRHPFKKDDKVSLTIQDELSSTLVFYNCIQPHEKQSDRSPENVRALWDIITVRDNIEVWSQPIGGDGRYSYIDPNTSTPYRVTHNGRLWENNFQSGLNVWEPGVFGWTDIGPA